MVNTNNVSEGEEAWYADSGASEHMSYCKKLFRNFVHFSEENYKVRIGDGTRIDVKGRGYIDVKVTYTNGTSKIYTIANVLFVPKLNRNLLSVRKTTEKGIKVTFKEGGDRVIFEKNNKLILDGVRCENLYKLQVTSINTSETNVVTSDTLKLWHERCSGM